MASASDIITYAGVPLTIVGVLPLIWNLVASLIIFRRLRSSIPSRANHFFKLTVNPVAGSVVCSFFETHFRYNQLRSQTERRSIPFGISQIHHVEDHWLGATWMSFLSISGLLQMDRQRYPCRFTVDSAMDCQFIGLKCDWPTFVYLVLALGASPYDECLLAMRKPAKEWRTLPETTQIAIGTNGEHIMIGYSDSVIARLPSHGMKFSWRKALAWELVMVPVQRLKEDVVPLIPASAASPPVLGSSMADDPEDGFVCNPLGLESNFQREFKNVPDRLGASLTWALYVEDVLYHAEENQRELLPVPPQVLDSQEAAIRDLKRLHHEGLLEPRIGKLFLHDPNYWKCVVRLLDNGLDSLEEDKKSAMRSVLQEQDSWKGIYADFGPLSSPEDRKKQFNTLRDSSTEKGVLARVILAISPVNSWKPNGWFEELSWGGQKELMNPMGKLFGEKTAMPIPNEIYFG